MTTQTTDATTNAGKQFPPTQFYTYNRVVDAIIPATDTTENALPLSVVSTKALKSARLEVGEDVWKKGYNPIEGGATEIGRKHLAQAQLDATAGFFGVLTNIKVAYFDEITRRSVKNPDARQKAALPSKLMLFIARADDNEQLVHEALSLELNTDYAQSLVAVLDTAVAAGLGSHEQLGDIILIDSEMTPRVTDERTYFNERARLCLNNSALGYDPSNPDVVVEPTYVGFNIDLLKQAQQVEKDRTEAVRAASEANGLGLDAKTLRDAGRLARRTFMAEQAERIAKQAWLNGKDRKPKVSTAV